MKEEQRKEKRWVEKTGERERKSERQRQTARERECVYWQSENHESQSEEVNTLKMNRDCRQNYRGVKENDVSYPPIISIISRIYGL